MAFRVRTLFGPFEKRAPGLSLMYSAGGKLVSTAGQNVLN